MEVRDLYDKNRVFSGKTMIKGETVPPGLYYLVVFAIIEENGSYLIQKRSKEKGGKWSFTSGHPIHREDSRTGLIREVKEELNLDINTEDITLLETVLDEEHMIDIYHINMKMDEGKIRLQKEEVEDYKIVSSDEIEKIICDGEFLDLHAEKYYYLKQKREVFN